MSLMFSSIAMLMLAQAGPSTPPAAALSPVSVSGFIGRGQTWDDEGGIGAGLSAGGGVQWHFRPKWSVGGEVERLGHLRDTPGLRFSGRTVFVSANVVYRLAARGVTPYLGGGGGGAFYKGDLLSRLTPPPVTLPRSSTSTMAYGTAGLEILAGDRLTLSPEFRLMMCQPNDDFAPWSAMRFGVKAALRF